MRCSVRSGTVMSHIEIIESFCPGAKYVPPSPSPSPEIARVDTGILGESECLISSHSGVNQSIVSAANPDVVICGPGDVRARH
jgi:hypothetical protein